VHELGVTKNIFDIVIGHARTNSVQKVLTIHLRIGALSDLEDEWIQRYFDYLSRGSVAEGARLRIDRIPAVFRCESCSSFFESNLKTVKEIRCPDCRSQNCTLVSGDEYQIENMEAV
jgi:hydrogenase nickel incorporation protein HypA/HybF